MKAVSESDGRQRLQAPVGELDRAGYTAAGRCLADDLDALVVHLRYPTRRRWRSTNLLERSLGSGQRQTCRGPRYLAGAVRARGLHALLLPHRVNAIWRRS
jgi:hypothetical protein